MCLGWHRLAPWGQTLHIFCRVFSSAVHIAIPPIFNKTIASFNLLVLSCLFAGNNAFGSPKILVGVNSNFILRILVIKKLQKCACHAFPCYPRSKMTKLTRRIIGNNATQNGDTICHIFHTNNSNPKKCWKKNTEDKRTNTMNGENYIHKCVCVMTNPKYQRD